jgi:hypothetical protein
VNTRVRVHITSKVLKKVSVETILGRGGEIKGNDGRVNITKINCKHFHKCNNVPTLQQKYNKNKIKKNSFLRKNRNVKQVILRGGP